MKSKEEILGQSFYPHECGGMIDCVTKLDALKAMEEYAQQFASQPPAQGEGRMWEEIPVTELKPEDTIENDEPKYFLLLKDREFIGLGFFAPITKIWVVDGRKRTPTHYLRPVTGQRYSEAIEIVKELAEWSEKYPRQTVYPVSADIDGKLIAIEEKAKQFIQSLNKK